MDPALKEKISSSLQSVRPFLQSDGGDVEFVNISEDGVVEVRLVGACASCPMSIMTLRAGIERWLMREFQEVRRVESVVK